jgi:ubiquinone/menaquinone biosynthesis C-methylase UbiE
MEGMSSRLGMPVDHKLGGFTKLGHLTRQSVLRKEARQRELGRNMLEVKVYNSSTPAAPQPSQSGFANDIIFRMVEGLFSFPPFFNFAASRARKMIVDRGELLGLDFAEQIERLRSIDWDGEIEKVHDPDVATRVPAYYIAPFHAYPMGNLCLEAALEVTVAAQSVHASVMDPAGKALDPDGDRKLRLSYSQCMLSLMDSMCCEPLQVQNVLDIGAATGLSSLALLQTFPMAEVTGIDLSPHFIAVGRYMQREREISNGGRKERLSFVYGAAEETNFPDNSFDLASMCLVCHELPQAASRAIFKEAARVLRPGGVLSIMEMNPDSPAFQRVLSNPVPYAVFKSTEPYLMDYIQMDIHQAIMEAGFEQPKQLENSPRHRTIVARLPAS